MRENAQLRRKTRSSIKRVEILHEQIAWLKSRFFGRSSESLSEEEKRQLRLFDEAESGPAGRERPRSSSLGFAFPSTRVHGPSVCRCPKLFPAKKFSSTFLKSRSTASVGLSWCASGRKPARSWM